MANTFNKKNNSIIEPRINDEIKGVREVRLIYKEHKDSVSTEIFDDFDVEFIGATYNIG